MYSCTELFSLYSEEYTAHQWPLPWLPGKVLEVSVEAPHCAVAPAGQLVLGDPLVLLTTVNTMFIIIQ